MLAQPRPPPCPLCLNIIVRECVDTHLLLAPVVLRDQIQVLGESLDNFPETKLDELIGLVSREISDGKLRNKFEELVFQEISNFNKKF